MPTKSYKCPTLPSSYQDPTLPTYTTLPRCQEEEEDQEGEEVQQIVATTVEKLATSPGLALTPRHPEEEQEAREDSGGAATML